MPAYNFQDRFADAVELGRKPHTIRPGEFRSNTYYIKQSLIDAAIRSDE